MGPAEIVASLKELCAEKGPRLTTEDIVAWIDRLDGFGSSPELIQYAKKMKARQYARLLEFEDEESGLRIKRLWSFHDPKRSRRFYMDILEMPDEQRTRLIRQYRGFSSSFARCARRWPTTSPASGSSSSIPAMSKRRAKRPTAQRPAAAASPLQRRQLA